MPQVEEQIDRLLLSDPDKSHSVCHIFVAHPTPLEERQLGKIFLICEIDSQNKINHDIINVIQEEAKKNYYYSTETNLETAFENSLAKVNEALHQLISEGVTHWLDKFNIIIGVLRQTELTMTSIGRMHAFLIHREKIIDILDSGNPREPKLNPLKIFSNITSGNLSPTDQLLFCTSSLLDYFSQEKLKKVISENPPAESVSQLEKILLETDMRIAFGAIIIKMSPAKIGPRNEYLARPELPSMATAPQTSMDDLIRQEEKTSQYLSPSLIPNVFKSIGKYTGRFNDFFRAKILKKSPRRHITENYYRPVKKEEKPWRKTGSFIYRGIFWVIKAVPALIIGIFKLFRRRDEIKGKIKAFPYQTEQKIHGGIFRFRRLNPRARKTLVFALVILFIFSASIVIIGQSREASSNTTNKEAVIKEIQDKTFEAGSALTYEDEKGAKTLLAEAQDLLNQWAKKIGKEQTPALQNGINTEYEKTKHIVSIQSPNLIQDLAALTPAETANAIFSFGNFLYLFNGSEVIKIDLNTKTTESLKTTLTDIGQFALGVKATTSSLLLFHDRNGAVEYNTTTKKFTPQTITFPDPAVDIKDIAVYQSRFYFLDVKNNQIYRFQKAAAGFGVAVAWVTDGSLNLTDSVSLTIDGSIYFLKNNGQVIELAAGKQVDFSLDTIDPALTAGTKIWTDQTATYIYVLDPANKRLVQFTKKGIFKNQYTSDQFTDLKSFSINEKSKTAYLLAGTKIFQIDLNI